MRRVVVERLGEVETDGEQLEGAVMGVAASEVEATVVVVLEAVVMEVAAMAEAETA